MPAAPSKPPPDGNVHPLRCRCGVLQGAVQRSRDATRAVCYCRDCQAYARHLATPGVVDAAGGTDVVASHPRHVRFTAGVESLACLSLSPRGILRWYASCCRTPIGNTPRNRQLAYVGLVHNCLQASGAPPLDSSFGPPLLRVNTESARAPVEPSSLFDRLLGGAHIVRALAGARLSGSYRDNPFFDAGSGEPVRHPYVLTLEERGKAYGVAAAGAGGMR